jgi:hypothetical protein
MDEIDMIKQIEKAGDLFEVMKITTYRGYDKETQQEVKIEVQDMGPDAGETRYSVVASLVDKPEKFTSGNPAASVDVALAMVHWGNLKN